MKNNKNIGLIILGIILLSLIIYAILKPEQEFSVIELDKKNVVVNRTSFPYLDTITHVGLSELNIEGITILIREIEKSKTIEDDYDVNAYVVATRGGGDTYLIFIKKGLTRLKAIDILSHELVHIKQYDSKKLILVGDGYVTWKGGDVQDIGEIPYMDREWEKEAFSTSPILRTKLSNKLYE